MKLLTLPLERISHFIIYGTTMSEKQQPATSIFAIAPAQKF